MLSQRNTGENRKKLAKLLESKALICKNLGKDDLMRESIRLAKHNAGLAEKIESNEDLEKINGFLLFIDRAL